jgi:hypothetical protein
LPERLAREPRPLGCAKRLGGGGHGCSRRRRCRTSLRDRRQRDAIAELLHAQHQLARIDRLRDVVVGADAEAGEPIVDRAAAGEEHQRDAGGLGMPFELPRRREAVLIRHLDVE